MEMLAIPCIIANSQEELDRNLSHVLGKVVMDNINEGKQANEEREPCKARNAPIATGTIA